MTERGPIQLTPGLPFPDVSLPATDGSHVNLATLRGRNIVAVYPWTGDPGIANPPGWDDIPGAHGSTPELEGFHEVFELISHAGARLFAVSGQTTEFQREMALRLELPFPILSDGSGALRRALDLPTFEAGPDSYLKRLTVVVLDGKVEHVFFPIEDPEAHAADVVDWLKSQV